MFWIIKKRMVFLFLFYCYFVTTIVGKGIYYSVDFNQVMKSLAAVLIGAIVAVIEYFVVSGRSKKKYSYGMFGLMFVCGLLIIALVGPIIFLFYPVRLLEVAGLTFVVTGISLTLDCFLPLDKVENKRQP
jgi:hypothetical protein